MANMLISVQQITEALASGERAKAAAAARAAGGHANAQIPIGLMAKLPLEFKQAGSHSRLLRVNTPRMSPRLKPVALSPG
jgi:hypothetical protein